MSTNQVDPVTGIVIPTPGQEPGPTYASDVSNALLTVAHLTHTGVANLDGYQIPSAGININADLSAQGFNLTNLRSTRYQSQSSPLVGSGDINALYFNQGEFWLNDGAGQHVQVSKNGVLNSTTSINYPSVHISTNTIINNTDGYVVYNISTTAAPVSITLPAVSAVPVGHSYIFADLDGTAGTNNITINAAGSDQLNGQSQIIMLAPWQALGLIATGFGTWNVLYYARTKYGTGDAVTFSSNSMLNLTGTASINVNTGTSLNINTGGQGLVHGTGVLNIAGAGTANIATDGYFTIAGTGLANLPQYSTPRSVPIVFKQTPYIQVSGWDNTNIQYFASSSTGVLFAIPIPTINRATLSSLTMQYQVASSHFPDTKLSLQLLRFDQFGTAVYLSSTTVQFAPGTNAATYFAGTTMTYTCNQNNFIDKSQYSYFAIIEEENGSGSSAGNRYYGFQANYTNVIYAVQP